MLKGKSSIRRSNVLFKPKSFRRRLDRKNQPRHAYALFQPESAARARIGSDNRIGSIRIRPRPLSYCAITSIPFGIPLAKSQLVPRSNSECIRPVCIFSLHKGDNKGKNCSMANSSLTSGSLLLGIASGPSFSYFTAYKYMKNLGGSIRPITS